MGYCEICYAVCEARYCAGCAPSAPAPSPQVVLKRESRLDGHSDRVYDVAWGSNNRLASVGQVGGMKNFKTVPRQRWLRLQSHMGLIHLTPLTRTQYLDQYQIHELLMISPTPPAPGTM